MLLNYNQNTKKLNNNTRQLELYFLKREQENSKKKVGEESEEFKSRKRNKGKKRPRKGPKPQDK